MAESGCYSIGVGVESASNETLRKIGKRLRIEEVDEFLKNAKGLPMRKKGFFMIGFPWETEEDVLHTINYAVDSGFDDVTFNIAMAYPSTPLYNQLYGVDGPVTLLRFARSPKVYGGEDDAERYLSKYGTTPSQSLTKNIPIERLIEMKELAFMEFYDGK
ncbi:unnamed protein product [marine sediment metagenome]|uniref:Radical SAM core domain-containing protein n=1 Tax=marine sediment metagenome TaxID=412755 RepID=X0V9F2_9ZZZZ